MKTTIKAKPAALNCGCVFGVDNCRGHARRGAVARAGSLGASRRSLAWARLAPGPMARARLGLASRLLERRRLVQRLVGSRGRGGSGRRCRGRGDHRLVFRGDCWHNRPVYDAYGRWLGNRTVDVCR